MTLVVKINFLLILLGLDLSIATFNLGNSILIIDDSQGLCSTKLKIDNQFRCEK